MSLKNAHMSAPGFNIRQLILKDVIQSTTVLSYWEEIAHRIPSKYEPYSLELLQAIVDLWITIHVYSFADNWTMQFVGKYKTGTRKTLKQKQ